MGRKRDYLEEMEVQVEQWSERIEHLMKEAEHSNEIVKGKLCNQIKSLRAKQECARIRLERARKVHHELPELAEVH